MDRTRDRKLATGAASFRKILCSERVCARYGLETNLKNLCVFDAGRRLSESSRTADFTRARFRADRDRPTAARLHRSR